jgi:demethylmenaquinone methyltransferase/2-methoxy-6-polyprenyl-1,4-benzoquinol methylase
VVDARTAHARKLFDGIAPSYEAPAELFSFFQYGRWRRSAVRRIREPRGLLVLDVATGTGLVARDLRRRGARVVGLDQSFGMLARARDRGGPVLAASAEQLPVADQRVDALSFTYLLRYVNDPAQTLAELVRVLKPGGVMVSVEFGLPRAHWARALWKLYALRIMPPLARLISPGWRDVGDFLGPSIVSWASVHSPEDIARMWEAAGMIDVRWRAASFGAGIIMWGRKRG